MLLQGAHPATLELVLSFGALRTHVNSAHSTALHVLSAAEDESRAIACLDVLLPALPEGSGMPTANCSRDLRGRNAFHTAAEAGRLQLLRALAGRLVCAGLLEEDDHGCAPADLLFAMLASASSSDEAASQDAPRGEALNAPRPARKDVEELLAFLEGKLGPSEQRAWARRRGTRRLPPPPILPSAALSSVGAGAEPISGDTIAVPSSALAHAASLRLVIGASGAAPLHPGLDLWSGEEAVAEDDAYAYVESEAAEQSAPTRNCDTLEPGLMGVAGSVGATSASVLPPSHPQLAAARSSSLGLDLQPPGGIHVPPDALRLSRQR
jgi:hypothetical protein